MKLAENLFLKNNNVQHFLNFVIIFIYFIPICRTNTVKLLIRSPLICIFHVKQHTLQISIPFAHGSLFGLDSAGAVWCSVHDGQPSGPITPLHTLGQCAELTSSMAAKNAKMANKIPKNFILIELISTWSFQTVIHKSESGPSFIPIIVEYKIKSCTRLSYTRDRIQYIV